MPMPDKMMVSFFEPLSSEASINTSITDISAPIKEKTVVIKTDEKNRIPNAAPALAPEAIPMISGDARGFFKTVCKTYPLIPKAIPPITPVMTLDNLKVTKTCL